MGIDADLSIDIRADPEIIWGLLVTPGDWKTWWRACVAARIQDDRTLREGSEIEILLQPRTQKITLQPVVDLLTENKTLSFTHRSFAVQTTTTWYLSERPDRTRVNVQAVFNGLLPCFMSILQQRRMVEVCLKGNLQGLRRAAERISD